MSTQGARLKQIRLEKGLTLEEVHARTKIHIDILKALEEDAFVNLSPVYRKSFLKIYCKYLGVSPDEFIEQEPTTTVFSEAQSQATTVPKPAPRISTPRRTSLSTATNNSVGFLKIAVRVVIVLLVVFFLFSLGQFLSLHFGKNTQRTSVSLPISKTQQTKSTLNSPVRSLVAVSRQKTQPSISQEPQEVLVSVQALDDVWMQVSVDGKLVFQNVLRRGRTESWRAKEKIVFGTIGSAASVRLVVNNKVYENLGSRRQIIKDLVVTSDGRLISSNR